MNDNKIRFAVLALGASICSAAFSQQAATEQEVPKNAPYSVFGEGEVDPDLPLLPKSGTINQYLIYSEPPTALHSKYSDLNRIRWLTVPHDSTKPIDQKTADAISDAYIRSCKSKAEKASVKDAPRAWIDLGLAIMYRSRWDEAIAAFEKAATVNPSDQQNIGEALYRIADCHMGAGRREKAKEVLEEMLSRKLKCGGWRSRTWLTDWNAKARQVMHYLDGQALCALDLPRWTGYRAFPEAQQATYTEKFVPAPVVSIKVEGFNPRDIRIGLMKKKLSRRGVQIAARGGYVVDVALDPNAPLDKSESYTLESSERGVKIRARDMQGVLWGVVSFLQIYDYEAKRMRVCTVNDWPDCPKRGFLGRCCVNDCEFMIFNKMNINTAKPNFLHMGEYTPFNLYMTKQMAREHNALGFDLYFGFGSFTMDVAWPLCWNVFLEMQLENARKWVECGVGIYYPYDDARYWDSTYTKEDKATGLAPSDYDAKHLLKFFNRLKAEFPNFKMQFCPPFYWGPRAGHPYPDSRTKYLKSLQILPQDVTMFWTGERVGSHRKKQGDCKWYTELIGRKPSLFQNKAGPHLYLSYVLDEMPWDEWYYPGFVSDDMASIQKNSDTPEDYPILSTLADYLWNVKAYDRKRSVKNGLDHYAGKGVYDILKPAYDRLCRLDAYRYGAVNALVLQEDPKWWEEGVKIIEEATAKAREIAGPTTMRGFGSWGRAVGWFKGIAKAVKNPPDYHKRYAKPYALLHKNLAEDKVISYDEGKDIFVDPLDIKGVIAAPYPTSRRRPILDTSSVAAAFYAGCKARTTLKLDKVPAGGVRMFISGTSTHVPRKFRVTVNDVVVSDVKNPFKNGWKTFTVDIPADKLKKGENIVKMYNYDGNGYPIYIQYIVFRKI